MLIDDIKPEVLARLDRDYEKYNTSINGIYNVLSTKEVYSQLTIHEITEIIIFAELNYANWSPSDIIYGDRILNNNN